MAVGACNYPCPQNWNDFEDMIFHIYHIQNPNVISNRYGRLGQNQLGIDIYAQDSKNTVIQCKNFTITTQDIDDIYNKIYITNKNYFNTSHIIIANTGLRDTNLQNHAINKKTVELWFWDDICSFIDFYRLGPNLYPTLYPLSKPYSNEIQSFFSDFTQIINGLGNQVPGYIFDLDLACFIGDNFLPFITRPPVLELVQYQARLNVISEYLNQILKIYNSNYYNAIGKNLIFDQANDVMILRNNEANYLQILSLLNIEYEKMKQLLV